MNRLIFCSGRRGSYRLIDTETTDKEMIRILPGYCEQGMGLIKQPHVQYDIGRTLYV